MATIQTIKEVNSATGLYDMYDEIDSIEEQISHGDNVELIYKFSLRIPLLRTYADQINNDMTSRNIEKWAGDVSYATVEEDNQMLRVRFIEGSPLFGIVFVVIMGIIIIALVCLILFSVGKLKISIPDIIPIPPVIKENMSLILAAGGIALIIWFFSKTGGSTLRPP